MHAAGMQLTVATRPSTQRPLSIAGGVAAGTVLVVAGLTLAYATFATPLVASLAGGNRFGSAPGVPALVTWALAIVATAVFLAVGAARLAEIVATTRPTTRPLVHPLAAGLPPDVVMIHRVDVGDGRPVPELLIGGFGVAVVRSLPEASLTRREGPYWEARTDDGWVRIENPLDRAVRDAERVRRWFSHDDRDFVVRVYAAVVAPDASLPRTPTCAVITVGQLSSWLASLPVQRSLTEARRAQLVAMVRAAG
jgi:hypothetical protein